MAELPINEIIFSEPDLEVADSINLMKVYAGQCFFSFYSAVTNTIINSYHKNATGISFTASGSFNLSQPYYKRTKRLVDISVSFLLLISCPVQLMLLKKGGKAIKNCWLVFTGYQTFIGYHFYNNNLPEIKPCIFKCSSGILNESILEETDKMYAKDYDYWTDIQLIISNYPYLGR